jgi:hypothetical protein
VIGDVQAEGTKQICWFWGTRSSPKECTAFYGSVVEDLVFEPSAGESADEGCSRSACRSSAVGVRDIDQNPLRVISHVALRVDNSTPVAGGRYFGRELVGTRECVELKTIPTGRIERLDRGHNSEGWFPVASGVEVVGLKSSSLLNEPVLDSKHGQFEAVRHADLVEDVG